ncbi:KAP family P-loop NTPase fold protein [Rosenbergiella epipactidis]|uniref:KAP family P-loop NTPase fold protein n=1 Tax=Rosenbergiella epipactidis TaxID=1544694 RepID=UPI001F4E32B5|nr:P-loop NTPase fold protein [Rosenbergiella epipactidis]
MSEYILPNDDFQRENIAINIAKIILSDNDVSPMLINGDWGTGKTVLAHRIQKKISKNESDVRCIYINAFQEDHVDNALITLVSAVAKTLPNKEKVNLLEKAKPAIRFGLSTIAKGVVSHVLRTDSDSLAEEYTDMLKEMSGKTIDYAIDNMLEDHIKSEESIEGLKSMLKALSEKNKIIIIIDELDRCNPYFAIDLVEKIKYVFDMDGIKFILLANSSQLEASIKNRYGGLKHGAQYLEKFIKYTIDLPIFFLENGNDREVSSHHFDKLIPEIINIYDSTQRKIIIEIKELIISNSISLREVENYIRNIKIYQLLSDRELKKDLPIILLYKLTFIFIYTFSQKFEISLRGIKENSSIIYKIKGLELDKNNKKPQLNQLICHAITNYRWDDFDGQYESYNDSKDDEILKEIHRMSPNEMRGSPNYKAQLLSVFSTLSFI